MAYQSLYRRYRPQGFEQGFVGQKHIKQTLQNSLRLGRLNHAYLFAGPRGTGKTTTAKIFAKAVNCLSEERPVAEPCNQCEHCLQVTQGNAMDVIEMDAATNRGIEEVRDLRDRVQYAPALGRYKVYIIDEVHMLTTEAFNALLKTLEEPPSHVIFIMATTEPQKIPSTILSRCQRFDFRPLTEQAIVAHLQFVADQQNRKLDQSAANLLAFRAQGGMRDALGLLEQVMAFTDGDIQQQDVWHALGTVDDTKLVEFANALHQYNLTGILTLLDEFGEMGIDYRQALTDLLELLRSSLLQKTGLRKGIDVHQSLALESIGDVVVMMEAVADGIQESRHWAHPRLAVELMAVKYYSQGNREPTAAARGNREPPAAACSQKQLPPQADVKKLLPEKWEDVLSLVKKQSISSYAWLKEASPRYNADSLELVYPENYQLHCDNIKKPEHQQNIIPAIRQVLGITDYQVTIK